MLIQSLLPVEKSRQPGGGGEVYQQDGDYVRDIEVNDLRNRYTLTKGATQKMVNIHFAMSLMHPGCDGSPILELDGNLDP